MSADGRHVAFSRHFVRAGHQHHSVTNTTVTPVYCRDRPDVTLPDGKFMKGDTARRAPCVFGILTCTPLLCIHMTHTLIFNYSRGAVA